MHRFLPLNWVQWLSLATAVSLAIIMPIIVSQLQSVQGHQDRALHSIICFVEYREKATLPPKRKQQAVEFWAKALRDAHLSPCP